jgi:hypothetical protein
MTSTGLFEERARAAGIDEAAYSLYADRDESYCLISEAPGSYLFYYSERGLRSSPRHFSEETDALEYLLGQLVRDQSTRTSYRQSHRVPPSML